MYIPMGARVPFSIAARRSVETDPGADGLAVASMVLKLIGKSDDDSPSSRSTRWYKLNLNTAPASCSCGESGLAKFPVVAI
jgi:hypothetical protein